MDIQSSNGKHIQGEIRVKLNIIFIEFLFFLLLFLSFSEFTHGHGTGTICFHGSL